MSAERAYEREASSSQLEQYRSETDGLRSELATERARFEASLNEACGSIKYTL